MIANKTLKALSTATTFKRSIQNVRPLFSSLSVSRNSPISFFSQRRAFSQATSDLDKSFSHAVQSVSKLTEEPSNDIKLKLYALYTQVSKGPCDAKAKVPGMFDLVGKAKFQAWSSLKDLDKATAQRKYVELVTSLFHGKLPADTTSASTSTSSAPANTSTSTSTSTLAAVQTPTLQSIAFPRKQASSSSSGGGEGGQVESTLTSFETVTLQRASTGIATLTLNRPSKLNALNLQMWLDLQAAFAAIERDEGVRCVLLRGHATKGFTAGMDLKVFADMQGVLASEPCVGRQREGLVRVIAQLQDIISAPERCVVPVIAVVSGHCIGAGVDLITACDLRYCTADAAFCVKETDLAMVADVGTLQRLPKLIGDQQARELAYTSRVVGGREAERMGLVLRCFETYEEMLQHVEQQVALKICAKSPLTIRGIKSTVLYTRDHTVRDSLQQIQLHNAAMLYSQDLEEAVVAGMGRRPPLFKN